MSELVPNLAEKKPLRVAICSSARAEQLRKMAIQANYVVVRMEEADVLLCDGIPPTTNKPAVVLGGNWHKSLGALAMNASDEQIAAALQAVFVGLRVVGATSDEEWNFGKAFEELSEQAPTLLLTPRELQVLAAIGDGLSNKAIARRLSISQHTVKFHIESLFRKLDVRTRAEAVARAIELGADLVNV
jgi:DNA-binding CsgD family transcriptional regulator